MVKVQNKRVIELIGRIVALENETLNGSIKDLVVEANESARTALNKNDPNLIMLMEELGETEEAFDRIKPYELASNINKLNDTTSKEIIFPSIQSSNQRKRYSEFTTPNKRKGNLYQVGYGKNANQINSFDSFKANRNANDERSAISERESIVVFTQPKRLAPTNQQKITSKTTQFSAVQEAGFIWRKGNG